MGIILDGTNGISTPDVEPTGSTVPTNGVYLPAANSVGIATNSTNAVYVDSSQNVGIGTSSPSSNSLTLASKDVVLSDGYGPVWGTTTKAQIAGYSSGILQFFAGGSSERMRIESSGNLLVGTTTANGLLSVTKATDGSTAHIYNTTSAFTSVNMTSRVDRAATTAYVHFAANSNGTAVCYIYGNGNIQNTNNSYGAISDAKLKENIIDATPKLADLMQVKVRSYNLIGNAQKQIGVVAQELEQVFPGMVDESSDRDAEGNDLGTTTKSVKYSVFVPMLIKAIQEQQTIIEQLKARLDAAGL